MQRILILTFISAVFAESNISIYFDCSKLQFWEKEKVVCNASTPIFHCAWDLFSKQYEMKCLRKPILIRIGNRPTIQGGLHYGPCSEDRYQPFHIVSNRTVDCWYLKNNCMEEGQVLCDNRTGDLDRTCRCDYTKGYAFVQSPKNNFSCIPSEEDCSCYKKICRNGIHSLNPEYDCVDSYNTFGFTGTCLITDKSLVTTPKMNNVSSHLVVNHISVSDSGVDASATVFVLTFFAILLVLGILKFGTFCARRCKTIFSDSYSRVTIVSNTMQQVENHRQDDTYYNTSTVNIALETLRLFNTLIIVGLEGSGKSSLCLEIAKRYKDNRSTVLIISFSDMKNAIHLIRPNTSHTELYILDVNLKHGENEDLLKICKNYCKSPKLKFIITTTSNYGSDELFLDKFEVKQHLRLDPLCRKDKVGILEKYMSKTKINRCDNTYESNYEDPDVIENPEKPIKMYKRILDNIVDTNTFTGFPSACQKFFSNRSLLHLEHRYFNTPSESVISQINMLRNKTDSFEKIKYAVLVYIMMKERTILPNLQKEDKTLHLICKKIRLSYSDLEFFQLKDAAKDLERTFLKCSCNVYEFNHTTMLKAVWMSYIDADEDYCLLNCYWSYIEDYIRPCEWPFHEYDVCIRPVKNSLIIERLEMELLRGSSWSVSQYLLKCYPSCFEFINTFCQHYMKKETAKFDVYLNLCSAFSKVGTSFEVFKKCLVAKDMLFYCNMDPFGNCLLHYCVLQDYEGMLSDMPNNVIDIFCNVLNKKHYSPCHLEFYFGRKELIEKHINCIPRKYEYYSKLNKLYHVGERNFGRIIETKHLNVIGQMDLQSDVLHRAKFGTKQDFMSVKDMLLKIKNESMVMIRIKQLPPKVVDTQIANVLETFQCVIIKHYRERYRQKRRITNIETGDRIVICEPLKNHLPEKIQIGQFIVEMRLKEHNPKSIAEKKNAPREDKKMSEDFEIVYICV
ncbi:SRP54 [Mytilus coruscus]|uniref:SRP54 n=1 Tax=Mytilus coruscus TaxID=42192 RepID=A0A6J8DE17_MYTCO|nr:SRP54 [Mytilus coruscus]